MQISHDHACNFIVRLEASFQDDLNLYLLMEYLQGGELITQMRNIINNGDVNDKKEAFRFYIAEIICALEYLHGKYS